LKNTVDVRWSALRLSNGSWKVTPNKDIIEAGAMKVSGTRFLLKPVP
jgi:hypothetical protein